MDVQQRLIFALVCLAAGWAIWQCVSQGRKRARRHRPDRPADKDAGAVIGRLSTQGSAFRAATLSGGSMISVDFGQRTIEFRDYTFVAAFVGNRRRDRTELRFADIIDGQVLLGKGGPFLNLRTTGGKVFIPGSILPFDQLSALLLDIVEVNRASPAEYRATLAREPVVKTPWWGWLIIAVSAVLLFLLWRLLWQLPYRPRH